MVCNFIFFFSIWVFLSRTLTNHRTAGESGGHFFKSSLSLPPASQALRHQPGYCCRELTSATLSIKKILFKKIYFVEEVRTDACDMTKKIVFTKYIYRKTPAMASFLVKLQTCGLTVFQNGLRHKYFSMKIVKFQRTSILQNNAP